MLLLQNGCSCSRVAVHPKNWQTGRHDLSKPWSIHYRFYQPGKPPKKVIVKGMNQYSDLAERRAVTKVLLENEISMLVSEGYNPNMKTFSPPVASNFEVGPETKFILALQKSAAKFSGAKSTKRDIRSVIKGVSRAVVQLSFDDIAISQVRRRHIKLILDQVETNAGTESYHRYNTYRTYLMILFDQLLELEATDINPAREIKKKKGIQRLRNILSVPERITIDQHLRKNVHEFWIFTNIFFHSGSRLTEIMRMKGPDVDLQLQRWKCLIKKGKEYREVWKTIKDIALPFWILAMKNCSADDFVFSEGLVPGPRMINTDQITKRWHRHVKKKLGITKDFYSLKHSNTDETAALIGLEAAAAHDDHTTPVITLRYAVNESGRRHEKLKKVQNPFA